MQENISHLIANIASASKTDDIYLIGKGPSIDQIDCAALPDGLVVNLNDSERIRPGHVGIFSANWVRHSLRESGYRCGHYLAGKPLPAAVPHLVLPSIPLELDEDELNTYRLQLPEFYDEPFVLITALKFAQGVARHRGRPQTVYLLGFDFSVRQAPISRRIGVDYAAASPDARDSIVHAQENDFRQFLRYYEKKDLLDLQHVGVQDFSALTAADFNRRIGGRTIELVEPRRPVAAPAAAPVSPEQVGIIAEFTNNHLGDADRLVEMVERAKAAGATLIKVQKRDVDTFYSPEQLNSPYWSPFGTTLGDYRRGVELDDRLLDVLDATCRRCGIEWFCSVLDYPSYQKLQRFKPRLLKIPSTISNHRDFHARIAADYHGALVVSTGFTEASYVDYVLRTFAQNERIYLMHCVSAYPTPAGACNVAVLRHYSDLAVQSPRIIPAYSSHDLGSVGCMLAVACGARVLEKHVKLGDVEWVHFDKVALDLKTEAFAEFVRDVRRAEEIIGREEKHVLDCEHHKYSVTKP